MHHDIALAATNGTKRANVPLRKSAMLPQNYSTFTRAVRHVPDIAFAGLKTSTACLNPDFRLS